MSIMNLLKSKSLCIQINNAYLYEDLFVIAFFALCRNKLTLGQLKQKALHGQNGAGIQDLKYAYNIRGWLEKISNPEVNPTTNSTQKLNLVLC